MNKHQLLLILGLMTLSAQAQAADTKDIRWQLRGYDKTMESFQDLWSPLLESTVNPKKITYQQQLESYPKHQAKFADAMSKMAEPKAATSTPEALLQRQMNEYPKTKEGFRVLRKKYK